MKVSVVLAALAFAGFAGAITYQTLNIPALVGKAITSRLDPALKAFGDRLDARDKQVGATLDSVKKTASDVSRFVNDTYYDNYANVEPTTVILRDVAEMTHTINTKILPDVTDLLANAKAALSVVQSTQKEVDTLAQSTDADLKVLKPVLDNAAGTLASLNTVIQTNSPEVAKLTDQAAKAIADLDKLVTDPNGDFAKTMGHVEGISASTDSIMKQMSKKVGLLKTILNAMVGIVKWNLTGPKLF